MGKSKAKGTLRAVIYLRVSTEMQAKEGTSLASQEAACLKKSAEIGASVVTILREEGVSGELFLARPKIREALRLADMSKGPSVMKRAPLLAHLALWMF